MSPSLKGRGRFRFVDHLRVKGLLPRRVSIYLPPYYDRDLYQRYPVVYAHDGQFAFDKGLRIHRALDELAAKQIIKPHILVTIDRSEQRSFELKPRLLDQPGPALDRYLSLLLNKVKPYIDQHFRTRCEGNATAVVGYSLGGLANMYIALQHSETFGRIAAMSPSLWWHRGQALQDWQAYKGPLPTRLWIDAGTREGRFGEVVPYFIQDTRRARDIAIHKGMTMGESLGYLEHEDAPHAGWAGAQRMRYALAFLLAEQRPIDHPASTLAVHVFRHKIFKHLPTTLAITASYQDIFRLTWPNSAATFTSSNQRVAQVNLSGVVQGLAPGISIIEAQLNGLYDEDQIDVY